MRRGTCLFALSIFCFANFSGKWCASTFLIDEKASIQKQTAENHDGKDETIHTRELVARLANLEQEMSLVKSQSQSQMEEIHLLKSQLEEQGKEIQMLKTVIILHRFPKTQKRETSMSQQHHPVILKRSKRVTSVDTRDTDQKIVEVHSASSEGCGVSSVSDIRVTGGRNSLVGQWPWMALVQIFGENNKKYNCGGVLISDRHVLTAAHCFEKSISLKPGRNDIKDNEVEVVLGLHNRSSPELHSVRFGRSSPLVIFLHEDYNGITLTSDIAIIQLSEQAVEFNTYIKPICLPSFNEARLLRGTAHIAGWGRNSTKDQKQFPDVLQDASVPLLNLESCKKSFKDSHTKVTDNHICAGKNGTDSCKGDSGGPLMLEVETNRWAVIGVVSWGLKSCDGEAPGVYLAVGPYVDWINEKRSGRDKPAYLHTDRNANHSEILSLLLPRIASLENQLSGLVGTEMATRPDCFKEEMPQSCEDLKCLGYKLNGFYSIKSADGNKIETVYCDFTSTDTHPSGIAEKRIGYVDHKSSSSVYFYVQRETSFEKNFAVVPFELERLNVGGAMNLTSGTFTTPVNGIYHFAFSGIKNEIGGVNIVLRVNGNQIGRSSSGEHNTYATLSLHSTVRLRTGDRVNLFTFYFNRGLLYDTSAHYTHFSGWLLEEDLSFE